MSRLVASALFCGTLGVSVSARGEPPETPVRAEVRGRNGDASVSVGVVRARVDARSELSGFVGVSLPLERFVAPRGLRVAALDGVAASSDELDDDGADSTREAAEAARVETGDAVVPALAPELFARLARDCVAAAENAHHAAQHEQELDGLERRARMSAVLPEVRVRAARSRDDSLRLQPTTDDPYRYSTVGGDGLWLEAQATFHLNRLLFADEEVAIERLRLLRERWGEQRAERVVARLVRWHRALSRERSLADEAERGRAVLERMATEAELDVLTDGWFGERVRRLGLAEPKVERRAKEPKIPAVSAPASKTQAPPRPTAVADLDARARSATSAFPCSPKLATDSKTSCGALMR